MSDLVFIDVQDQSRYAQRQVKSHVASGTHRQKRLVAISEYRRDADRHDEHSGIHNFDSDTATSNTNVPDLQQLRGLREGQGRWKLPSPSSTSVGASVDDAQVQLLLLQSSHWMQHQYKHCWSVQMQHDPSVYDLNTSLETFREAFYIVSDLLALDKVRSAFEVLNYTLDSVPDLLREPHPELLFALLELASGINMPTTSTLHATVKIHLADMARAMLGAQHPATLLLTTEFDSARRDHLTQLLMRCIINTLSATFGSDAYQTLVHQMGQSQFYIKAGYATLAQKTISNVLSRWREQYGDDSALSRLAMLELTLMRLQTCQGDPSPFEAEVNNSMQWIEVMSGISGSQPTGVLFPNISSSDPCSKTRTLARWLLLQKRYALALHVYNLAKGFTKQMDMSQAFHEPGSLNSLIANTVQDALGDELDLAEKSRTSRQR